MDEIRDIDELIRDAAMNGHWSISVCSEYVEESTINYFKKKRKFTVEVDDYSYKISWMPKKQEG